MKFTPNSIMRLLHTHIYSFIRIDWVKPSNELEKPIRCCSQTECLLSKPETTKRGGIWHSQLTNIYANTLLMLIFQGIYHFDEDKSTEEQTSYSKKTSFLTLYYNRQHRGTQVHILHSLIFGRCLIPVKMVLSFGRNLKIVVRCG